MLAGPSPSIELMPWSFSALQGNNALQGHGVLQLPQIAQSAKSSTSEVTTGEHWGIWWPSMCANWIAGSSDDWSAALLCRCKALMPVVLEGRSLDTTNLRHVHDLLEKHMELSTGRCLQGLHESSGNREEQVHKQKVGDNELPQRVHMGIS